MRTRNTKDLTILAIGLETPRFHLRLDPFLQTRRAGVDQVLAVGGRVAVWELRRYALDVAAVAEEARVGLGRLATFGGGGHVGFSLCLNREVDGVVARLGLHTKKKVPWALLLVGVLDDVTCQKDCSDVGKSSTLSPRYRKEDLAS